MDRLVDVRIYGYFHLIELLPRGVELVGREVNGVGFELNVGVGVAGDAVVGEGGDVEVEYLGGSVKVVTVTFECARLECKVGLEGC